MRVLWNKETGKAVQKGDVLQSFRNEPWIIEGWGESKVYAKEINNPKGFLRELYHTVFPALEWKETYTD